MQGGMVYDMDRNRFRICIATIDISAGNYASYVTSFNI